MPPRKNPYAKPDHFTRVAKEAGYPARSRLQTRRNRSQNAALALGLACVSIFRRGPRKLVASTRRVKSDLSGKLLAIDLEPLTVVLPPQALFVQGDAFALENETLARFAPYDAVLSDMAPRTTGNRVTDQTRSFDLCMRALAVAATLGSPGSAFVGKIFMSDDLPSARTELRRLYTTERLIRPEGTRAGSTERFLVGSGEAAVTASPPLAGRFVIEREVGRGAVGIVYRAHDQMTDQPVALKVIAIPGIDAGEEARFRREGRVLAGLHHARIVRVVAFGQLEEGQPYIAMWSGSRARTSRSGKSDQYCPSCGVSSLRPTSPRPSEPRTAQASCIETYQALGT